MVGGINCYSLSNGRTGEKGHEGGRSVETMGGCLDGGGKSHASRFTPSAKASWLERICPCECGERGLIREGGGMGGHSIKTAPCNSVTR